MPTPPHVRPGSAIVATAAFVAGSTRTSRAALLATQIEPKPAATPFGSPPTSIFTVFGRGGGEGGGGGTGVGRRRTTSRRPWQWKPYR